VLFAPVPVRLTVPADLFGRYFQLAGDVLKAGTALIRCNNGAA
jgi:hypothetical protein